MATKMYDFGGYATKYNVKCGDGRIIKPGAFSDVNGKTLPLVWHHNHEDMDRIIGHCLMEDRPDGMYVYGSINQEVPIGKQAKSYVSHGDLTNLSIWANHLREHRTDKGKVVNKGSLKEISLVLGGSNPQAFIDTLELAHGEEIDMDDFEGIIYSDDVIESNVELEIYHADDEKPKEEKPMAESNKKSGDDRTIEDVINEMTDEQKKVLNFLMEKAAEEGAKENKKSDDEGGDEAVKHNAFYDEQYYEGEGNTLSHEDMEAIISDGKRFGSLKESFLAHADDYGIKDIDWLFPEYKNLTDKPEFIRTQPTTWVKTIMSGIHHTPFSRIRMMFADITIDDERRARGYQKGNLKKEEVFGLLRRTVDPQTVYKKQKIDRDDTIDITDFDVVAWIKAEMREKLDEELARAFLFGDGRSASSEDKIQENHIIPIYNDAALYTIQYTVTVGDDEMFAHAFINASVTAQDDYQGSGNTTLFVSNKTITRLLLFEDFNGRRIYKTMDELALGLNVNHICKVPDVIIPTGVLGVIVDLADYTVGADKGGAVSMFDDFDIDYNQMKYLIETRCSGALTKPYSAIVLKGTVADGKNVRKQNFTEPFSGNIEP